MSGMFLGQTSSVVKEYQRAYPSEKEHLSKIEREERRGARLSNKGVYAQARDHEVRIGKLKDNFGKKI